jgi:predicted RNase H-like HicB family nuclease
MEQTEFFLELAKAVSVDGRVNVNNYCKIIELVAMLNQSENVEGSDTTGDDSSGEAGKNQKPLSAEEVLKKYTHSNILPYSEWLHKAMEEYKNQATPVKECYQIEFEHHEGVEWIALFPSIKGIVASGETKEDAFNELMISLKIKLAYDNQVTLPVTDWEKLEEKFFKEFCNKWDYEYVLANNNPNALFNWFKSNINLL